LLIILVVSLVTAFGAGQAEARARAELLVSGLEGASGSTVGPGGDLYVTEGAAGRVSRVDPRTGRRTTFASGLPKSIVGIGGAMDIAFKGDKAYVLVTLVGPDVGGTSKVGIYRIDGPNRFTVIADIGAFALANPPRTDFDVPTGLQYAIERYDDDFLVTDGHHNRVLRVTLRGRITEFKTFGNIVPTGLAVVDNRVFMAQAGPVPHLPRTGKVVVFGPHSPHVREVASGAPLLVDVEFGHGRELFALSQGVFTPGNPEGSPANPNTGSLLEVKKNGKFAVVKSGLDRPTSMEIIGDTAYVVSLAGQIWRIRDISDGDRDRDW
jgi:hypothetical protein